MTVRHPAGQQIRALLDSSEGAGGVSGAVTHRPDARPAGIPGAASPDFACHPTADRHLGRAAAIAALSLLLLVAILVF